MSKGELCRNNLVQLASAYSGTSSHLHVLLQGCPQSSGHAVQLARQLPQLRAVPGVLERQDDAVRLLQQLLLLLVVQRVCVADIDQRLLRLLATTMMTLYRRSSSSLFLYQPRKASGQADKLK